MSDPTSDPGSPPSVVREEYVKLWQACNERAVEYASSDKLPESFKMLQQSVSLARRHQDQYLEFASLLYLAKILVRMKDWSSVVETCQEGLRVALEVEARDKTWYVTTMKQNLIKAHLVYMMGTGLSRLGRTLESIDALEEGLATMRGAQVKCLTPTLVEYSSVLLTNGQVSKARTACLEAWMWLQKLEMPVEDEYLYVGPLARQLYQVGCIDEVVRVFREYPGIVGLEDVVNPIDQTGESVTTHEVTQGIRPERLVSFKMVWSDDEIPLITRLVLMDYMVSSPGKSEDTGDGPGPVEVEIQPQKDVMCQVLPHLRRLGPEGYEKTLASLVAVAQRDEEAQRWDRAYVAYEKALYFAICLAPMSPSWLCDVLMHMARVTEKWSRVVQRVMDHMEVAVPLLQAAGTRDRRSYMIMLAVVKRYRLRKEYEEAEKVMFTFLEKAVTNAPRFPLPLSICLLEYSVILTKLGRRDQAARVFENGYLLLSAIVDRGGAQAQAQAQAQVTCIPPNKDQEIQEKVSKQRPAPQAVPD